MQIRITKNHNGATLTCTRNDGTTTVARLSYGDFFARHDLLHFAVETTLGFRNAFFGLIAQGKSIAWFSQPGIARELPAEALHVELIVALIQADQASGTTSDAQEFNRHYILAASQSLHNAPAPRPLTDDELRVIRERHAALVAQYHALGLKESLELTMP